MPGQLKHPQLVLLCLWLYMQVQGQLKMRIGKGERFERDGKQCTAVRITGAVCLSVPILADSLAPTEETKRSCWEKGFRWERPP